MENRLFLLEEPGQDFGALRDEILAGNDVTPENEYSGKITLTQLNAYSGELTAEALSNFKTIKIEKNGAAYETNLAKLLLEIQQGGGADDAREEANIAIESAESDAAIKRDLVQLRDEVSSLHFDSSVEGLDGYELSSVEEYKHSAWSSSVEDADGVRTDFKSKEVISEASEEFLVVLNGVIVTPEDGDYINSQYGPYKIGFDFNVAPSVGDVVEFFGTRIAGKSSRPYADTIQKNEDKEAQAIDGHDQFNVEKASEKQTLEAELVGHNEKLNIVREDKKQNEAELTEAKAEFDAATSVSEINEYSKTIQEKVNSISSLEGKEIEVSGVIKRTESKMASIDAVVIKEESERKEAKQLFDASKNEMTEKVEMFEAISNELKGGNEA